MSRIRRLQMNYTWCILSWLYGWGLHVSLAIPIDNGVEGDPEVECGADNIVINFNTQNLFEGHVFVKGSFNDRTCKNSDNGRRVASIIIPFDRCNVMRSRSLNPRGIFVTTTVVITFHPNFITKIDRAYTVRCFYMETEKTLNFDIAVSDITTVFHTHAVAMPICKYEILEKGPDGAFISFAVVGQQVYHKWTCISESAQVFCMIVHSCTVDDGNGDVVTILDADGCALDKYILNNLEYPNDLMAGQEAHVYKYADRTQLYYQCQISITTKDRNETCPRPQCAEPIGRGAGSGYASLQSKGLDHINTADVSAGGENQTGTSDAFTNFSLPIMAGLNIAANSNLTPRLQDFIRRSKKDVASWKKHSIGTVDVRAEMNALDVMQQDVMRKAVAASMGGMIKLTSKRTRCYYSTIFLASLILSSCFLVIIATISTAYRLYMTYARKSLTTVNDWVN